MTSDIATVRQHVNCRARSSWTTATVLALGVLFSAYLASVRAHDSVAEVEAGFQQRNRYVQLTNETAGDFTLLDPDGQEFRLSDYRGKVIILNFLYSRCKEQCPQQSAKLAIVQRQLVKTGLASEVRFVTVATDTENAAGTAESLREQESRYGIAPVNWSFLHGGPGRESAGLRLAAEYGIKIETTVDDEQMHVVVTYLIDRDGQLRARYHGLKFDPVDLTVHAALLAAPAHHEGKKDSRVLVLMQKHWIALLGGVASLVLFSWVALGFFRQRRNTQRQIAARSGTCTAEGKRS